MILQLRLGNGELVSRLSRGYSRMCSPGTAF